MGICISHFSSLPHVILQILPTDTAAQVLHCKLVLRPGWGPIPAPRWRRRSAARAVVVGAPADATCQLHGHPVTHQILSVQLVHCIIRISGVVELHESKAVLDGYLADPAESFEEPFQIPFSDVIVQTTDVDT